MGFIGIILLGLIAGTIAKALLKDRAVGGWVASLVIGVVGAVVGGWIGSLLGGDGLGTFFSLQTWLLAIVGSVIVLWAYTSITGHRTK